MSLSFTRSFICESLHYDPSKLRDFSAPAVNTDSRSLKKDEVFVAIKGERFDGHDYVKEALERKAASIAIVSSLETLKGCPADRLICVKDTTEALRKIASNHRERLKTKIFAVGGSNGKTTTKELIAFLMNQLEPGVFKTKKSENSILGVALSLLAIREEDYAILEVGIDEPGWMRKHLEIIRPDAGIITTIQEEHLERLLSIEKVAEEELQLLKWIEENSGSFALNRDSKWMNNLKLPEKTLSYSLESEADIEGLYFKPNTLHAFGCKWKLSLPGKHNAQNLLAALTSILLLRPHTKLSELKELSKKVSDFKGEAHRSLWIEYPNNLYIYDDCYNANPSSMAHSLQTFLELSEGLKASVVMGDMMDLGESSDHYHRRTLNLGLSLGFEQVLLFGSQFKAASDSTKDKRIKTFLDFEELRKYISQNFRSNHCLFIKGSRGMRLERLLEIWEK